MGGSSSTSNVEILTKSAVEAITKNIMNCSSNTMIQQKFIIDGNYNMVDGFKQVQHLQLSSNCAQDTKNVENLQQEVSQAIQNTAKSQSVAVLGALGSSDAEANTKIQNEVSQKITKENIQNIVNSVNAQQYVLIKGNHNIVKNFEQSQTMKIVFDNTQKLLNELTSVQKMAQKIDQKAEAKQKGPLDVLVDIVKGVFDGLTGIGMLGVIMFITVAVVIGYLLSGPDAAEERKQFMGAVSNRIERQQPQYGQPMQQMRPMQPQYGQPMQQMRPMQPQYGQPVRPQYGQPVRPQYGQPVQQMQPQYGQPVPVYN